jgi:mannose-6-phosphate isomerase-like protein (cupin superfamily)
MTAPRALVLLPGEGRNISLGQHRQRDIVVKADDASTRNAYRMFESTVPPAAAGAPPHVHEEAEEGFYVLEGALAMCLGEETVEARPGTFVLVPRGVVHSFDNPGSVPARYLVIWTPAEAGRYFEELHEMEAKLGADPGAAEIADLRRRYHFRYLP